jgi:hypothetical protein
MKVTNVSASIRYSAEARGAWRSIELGVEATIAPSEDWHTAQQDLYAQLGEQLKTMWSKGASKVETEPDSWVELGGNHKAPLTPAPAHYCEDHQCPYRRYEREGQVWYSHKAPDGTWCKES